MRKFNSLAISLALMAITSPPLLASEGDTRFDIVRFQVDGNSLLPGERVQKLVAPFVGRRKVYGDIQKALEALENEYRRRGYGTVSVYVPEQELTSGVVKITVTEAVVGKVILSGNDHHDEANIRASLPQLREGAAPNMRELSENIQLANENPSKKVEVTFGVAEEEDKVNARVAVKDDQPSRFYVTVDNTGSKTTGDHRIGVTYQNANLMNRDHVFSAGYITAISPPNGVKIDVYSLGYRFPIYDIGDSIDIVYANSSSNVPANALGGTALGTSGSGTLSKGEVYALRYNHIFARQGEYSSKLVAGLDYKYINSTCTPAILGTAGCTPYTLRPVTLTYSGQWQRPGEAIDVNFGGVYHAFPMGSVWGSDRYSVVANRNRSGNDRFTAIRFGGAYTGVVADEWTLRAAFSGQHAQNPLPDGEQIGLSGANAVRGLLDRSVAADRGYFGNLEVYTPDYAPKLGLPGNLKALAFYDFAAGHRFLALNDDANRHIASVGLGFRYNLNKDIVARFDVARVLDNYRAGAINAEALKPKVRGHFSFAYGF